MKKVSVIVPIYKTPLQELRRCVDSLLNQSYTNLDIILVDDGSNDKEIDNFILSIKDTRVVAYKKENGGVSSARNKGLLRAKGDYISFVDSDDWVEPGFIQHLVANIEMADAALSIIDIIYEYPCSKNKRNITSSEANGIHEYQNNDIWRLLLHSTQIGGYLWNKLFKKELITQLLDEHLHYCEDFVFVAEYCKHAPKAVFEDIKLYHYRQGERNATSNYSFNKRIMTLLDSYQQLENIYAEYSSDELNDVEKNTLKIALNLRARYRLNKIEDSESLEIIRKVIADRMLRVLKTPSVAVREKTNILLTWIFPTVLFRLKNALLRRKE